MNLKEVLSGPAGELLRGAENLLVALVDAKGMVLEWNAALSRIWPLDATNRSLNSALTEASRLRLADLLAGQPETVQPLTLNFERQGTVLPQTYTCSLLAVAEGQYLFFAEQRQELEAGEAEEYVRLTNQLASRTRELEQTRHEVEQKNRELEESLRALEEERDRVKVLSGMLPICANCKKIRDDEGYWEQIESYIDRHSEARFSHGICPPLHERAVPGIH